MWQPIETAPKDGSFILLATPKGRIADGFWSPVYGVWSWPYVVVEPTHWMPLPELPGAQTQPAPSVPDADELAHFIRRIDGAHDLGASALAEKIVDWLAAAPEAKP